MSWHPDIPSNSSVLAVHPGVALVNALAHDTTHRLRPKQRALDEVHLVVNLEADRPIAGRIYLSGYGRSVREYEGLVGACDPTLASSLRRYCAIMLGDDLRYPTRSAVFSLGGHADSRTDCKLELCAHCALASDIDARERSLAWLDDVGVSAEPYRSVLDILSPSPLSRVSTELHVYLGVGAKQGAAGGLG